MEILSILKSAQDLPISIVLLVIFVWYVTTNNREWRVYLSERNGKIEKAFDRMNLSSENLEKTLDRNNKIMMRHLIDNGGSRSDIEELMK